MALPTLQRKLFKNDGYGPEIKDERLSADITVKDWDASHDYPVNVLAKAGGNIYKSVAVSGPGTSAGAKNPASDDGTCWTALSVDDDNVVHRTGDEDIYGTKTFKKWIRINNPDYNEIMLLFLGTEGDNSFFHGVTSNYTRGVTPPASTQYIDMFLADSNDDLISGIICDMQSTGNMSVKMRFYSPTVDNSSRSIQALLYNDLTGGTFAPMGADNNFFTLGQGGARWKQLYAMTAAIDTSDERLKTGVASFPDAVLDAWGEVGFVQYQFKDAVAEKGEAARLHSGLVAQRIDEAFKARGLDASRYALFCHDSWEAEPEQRDEKGNVVQPAREAGDEYSLRYEEALCMEAAYQRRRASRAEARIASLEARLAALEAKLNG